MSKPITAFRVYDARQVKPIFGGPKQWRLTAPYMKNKSVLLSKLAIGLDNADPLMTLTHNATCRKPHTPPGDMCGCGIYAVTDPLATLEVFEGPDAIIPVARIRLWDSTTPPHADKNPPTTVRGSSATIEKLFLIHDRTLIDWDTAVYLGGSLRDSYNVDVAILDRAQLRPQMFYR